VPLAPRLLIQLRTYWREQRPPHWLFPGTRIDRPMSRDGAWHIYVKARDKAGITKAGGLHLLRHYAACRIMPSNRWKHGSSLGRQSIAVGIKMMLGNVRIDSAGPERQITL